MIVAPLRYTTEQILLNVIVIATLNPYTHTNTTKTENIWPQNTLFYINEPIENKKSMI